MNKDSKPNIENMYKKKDIKNLIKALAHEDRNIQKKAINALVTIGKPAVNLLIQALRHKDYSISSNAAHTLVLIREKGAFEQLLFLIKKGEGFLDRRKIVKGLSDKNDKRVVEILIKKLDDKDPMSRCMAARFLARIGNEKALEPLIKLLYDKEFNVQLEAVESLGEIGNKRAVEPLIKVLGDDDIDIKCSAVCALGEIRDIRAVEPLIELLEDEDSTIRSSTISALGEIGDKRAVEPLIKLLKDEDKHVRCQVAFTLSALGDKRSVKPLRNFVKDEDSDIPHMISKAILTFTLEDLEEKYRPHPSTLEESVTIEFKSSLRYDIRKNCINEELGKAVVKNIAAFLNTWGGTLYIGVLNDGSICGIENDIKTLGSPNRDTYKQALVQLIINYLGLLLNQYLSIDFEEWEGKTICRIDLDRSREPIYFKGEEGKEFFIRFGPTTRKLDKKETKDYIISRWGRRKLNNFTKSNS